MENLSNQLQAAVFSGDKEQIDRAARAIAKAVDAQDAEKDVAWRKEYDLNACKVAKQYPCVACNGKLKHVSGHRFVCNKCKWPCNRAPNLYEEAQRQANLGFRIDSFKKLIKKAAKICGGKVDDKVTLIQGEPFKVFHREDYPMALAYTIGGRYHHESLRSGSPDLARCLRASVEIWCDQILDLTWEQRCEFRSCVKELPLEEQYPKCSEVDVPYFV